MPATDPDALSKMEQADTARQLAAIKLRRKNRGTGMTGRPRTQRMRTFVAGEGYDHSIVAAHSYPLGSS